MRAHPPRGPRTAPASTLTLKPAGLDQYSGWGVAKHERGWGAAGAPEGGAMGAGAVGAGQTYPNAAWGRPYWTACAVALRWRCGGVVWRDWEGGGDGGRGGAGRSDTQRHPSGTLFREGTSWSTPPISDAAPSCDLLHPSTLHISGVASGVARGLGVEGWGVEGGAC